MQYIEPKWSGGDVKEFGNPPRKPQIFPVPKDKTINVNGVVGSNLIKELDTLFTIGAMLPEGGTFVHVGGHDALALCCILTGAFAKDNRSLEVHLVGRYAERVPDDIERAGFKDLVRLHFGDTILMAEMFADQSIDTIYMDSESTYDEFLEEIRTWYPKKKPAGRMKGHDGCGNVRRALRAFCRETGENVSIIEPPKAHFLWSLKKGFSI
jgi:hypothetical protein